MSVAFPFKVHGERVKHSFGFPKNCQLRDGDTNATFFFFGGGGGWGLDNPLLHCLNIIDTTPYSCGRRKFCLACSHAQRPLRSLQSLLIRLIQPVPLQIICCQKQFFSPDFPKLIGLMFNKKYAERKYTLSFLWEYILWEYRGLNLRNFKNILRITWGWNCEKNVIW